MAWPPHPTSTSFFSIAEVWGKGLHFGNDRRQPGAQSCVGLPLLSLFFFSPEWKNMKSYAPSGVTPGITQYPGQDWRQFVELLHVRVSAPLLDPNPIHASALVYRWVPVNANVDNPKSWRIWSPVKITLLFLMCYSACFEIGLNGSTYLHFVLFVRINWDPPVFPKGVPTPEIKCMIIRSLLIPVRCVDGPSGSSTGTTTQLLTTLSAVARAHVSYFTISDFVIPVICASRITNEAGLVGLGLRLDQNLRQSFEFSWDGFLSFVSQDFWARQFPVY